MATIVASATGGNWNATAAWTGGVVPGAGDDVQLSAGSGNITINVNSACRSLDCTGYTGILNHAASVTLSVGDSTAGLSSIAMKTVAGMTYTVGSTTTSILSFISTSGTTQTLTTGGKTWPSYTMSGVGSSYQLADNNTVASASTVTLTAGTFDTNGKTCSWGFFSSNNSNTRALTMGASAITVLAQGTAWNLTTSTGMTLTPGTSVITYRGGNSTFQGGNLTYYGLVIGGVAGSMVLNDANTFTNLTFQGTNSGRLLLGANQTVTGLFTAASDSSTQLTYVQSSVKGTQRTVTAASATVSNIYFQDIVGAGAAAPFSTTNVGDMGNNSGITFPTGVTRYWVAVTGGNFMATSSWSTSSGGSSGASIPLPQDTVVFDSNSITSGGRTITINAECIPSLNFSNLLNSPTIAATISNGIIYTGGNLTYSTAVTPSGTTTIILHGRGSQTITMGGATLTNPVISDSATGTYTFSDTYTSSNTLTLTSGTLTASSNVSCTIFASSGTTTRALNLGSGTWTVTSTGTVWSTSVTTALTLNAGTSTIVVSDTSSTAKTVAFGTSSVYNNLSITGGGTGSVTISNTGTLNTLTIGAPKTVIFTSGNTYTLSSLVATGFSGNVITIQSSSAGTAFTITKSSGIVSGDYLSIKDNKATGGAAYYAGANSTDVSNNKGWAFYAPPSNFGNMMTTLVY